MRAVWLLPIILGLTAPFILAEERDYNELILAKLGKMPSGGSYARYRRDLPEDKRFAELYDTVDLLNEALGVTPGGKLSVKPERASRYSFCSSATYLLFCEVIADLQRRGVVEGDRMLSRELGAVGDKNEVIHGKLDGIGIFGHWNADGPGTAFLFQRLGIGRNFSSFDEAKPGDFLKIFWNENIGKGEAGHLVLYLGTNETGDSVQVWSSNMNNEDGSHGYGTMWVEKSRIQRALFSRLTHPQNLSKWLEFSEAEKTSDYLVRIRQTGSTGEEMKAVTAAE
ncbi:MAG: hypothetical protein AAGA96_20415 [Verrucomicrobiota bacterium]